MLRVTHARTTHIEEYVLADPEAEDPEEGQEGDGEHEEVQTAVQGVQGPEALREPLLHLRAVPQQPFVRPQPEAEQQEGNDVDHRLEGNKTGLLHYTMPLPSAITLI